MKGKFSFNTIRFTVFLERKALVASKSYGLDYMLIDAYSGNTALIEAIDLFG